MCGDRCSIPCRAYHNLVGFQFRNRPAARGGYQIDSQGFVGFAAVAGGPARLLAFVPFPSDGLKGVLVGLRLSYLGWVSALRFSIGSRPSFTSRRAAFLALAKPVGGTRPGQALSRYPQNDISAANGGCFRIWWDRLKQAAGAGRGTRTPTVLLPADFESAASTDSAIPARRDGLSIQSRKSRARGSRPAADTVWCGLLAAFRYGSQGADYPS
jgi:hypothetical protein